MIRSISAVVFTCLLCSGCVHNRQHVRLEGDALTAANVAALTSQAREMSLVTRDSLNFYHLEGAWGEEEEVCGRVVTGQTACFRFDGIRALGGSVPAGVNGRATFESWALLAPVLAPIAAGGAALIGATNDTTERAAAERIAEDEAAGRLRILIP